MSDTGSNSATATARSDTVAAVSSTAPPESTSQSSAPLSTTPITTSHAITSSPASSPPVTTTSPPPLTTPPPTSTAPPPNSTTHPPTSSPPPQTTSSPDTTSPPASSTPPPSTKPASTPPPSAPPPSSTSARPTSSPPSSSLSASRVQSQTSASPPPTSSPGTTSPGTTSARTTSPGTSSPGSTSQVTELGSVTSSAQQSSTGTTDELATTTSRIGTTLVVVTFTPTSTSESESLTNSGQHFPVSTASTPVFFTGTDKNGHTTSSPAPRSFTTAITSTLSDGETITVTQVISNPSGSLNGPGGASNSTTFFKNTGAVAGVFVVVGIAGASILLFILFACLRRRRRNRLDRDTAVAASLAAAGAGRHPLEDDDDDDETHAYRPGAAGVGGGRGQVMTQQPGSRFSPVQYPVAAAAGAYHSPRDRPYDAVPGTPPLDYNPMASNAYMSDRRAGPSTGGRYSHLPNASSGDFVVTDPFADDNGANVVQSMPLAAARHPRGSRLFDDDNRTMTTASVYSQPDPLSPVSPFNPTSSGVGSPGAGGADDGPKDKDMAVDQRLDPGSVLAARGGSGSGGSSGGHGSGDGHGSPGSKEDSPSLLSLDDGEDYSRRVLTIANKSDD